MRKRGGAELGLPRPPRPGTAKLTAVPRRKRCSRTYTNLPARLKVWMSMPTVEDVTEALTNVIDPELGLDFVELGLVYEVLVDEGDVEITFTLTTPACPIGPQVTEQMKE